MNAEERRGARLLIGAASLLAAFALISATRRLLANPESWLDELAGCGTILLILYFASRGGSFSIWLIWVLLIFTGFILLVACATVAIEVYLGRFHESRSALLQHSGAAWVLLGTLRSFGCFSFPARSAHLSATSAGRTQVRSFQRLARAQVEPFAVAPAELAARSSFERGAAAAFMGEVHMKDRPKTSAAAALKITFRFARRAQPARETQRAFLQLCVDTGCPLQEGRLSQAQLLNWLAPNYAAVRALAGLRSSHPSTACRSPRFRISDRKHDADDAGVRLLPRDERDEKRQLRAVMRLVERAVEI
jgi:hypothetical protein